MSGRLMATATAVILLAGGGVVVAAEDAARFLADVPEDQIERADLEAFIAKRPLDAYRIVRVDSDVLRALIRKADLQSDFELRLLATSTITLVATHAEEHSTGWQNGFGTWSGRVAGDDYSYAMFAVSPDGSVHGTVRSREAGRIRIEPIPYTPWHIVWRLQKGFRQRID